jgi:uncharacterized protein (TIGR00661 family)
MFFCKIVKNPAKITILTAPLDWGLGHATRCIPIIKELNQAGHKVIIAAEGPVKSLLELEFPGNLFVPLAGYKIRYSKTGTWLLFKLFLQIPKILLSVYKEHQWLKKTVRTYAVDLVVSDNRFGLFHATVPSVYITHQLFIKTDNHFSESMAQKMQGWFIKKYSECWVPDFESNQNIAGALSHPKKSFNNIKYIGCLSRFEKLGSVKKEFDLLILISGPEPQRSIFESILLDQLVNYDGKVLFIRGLPGNENEILLPTNLRLNPNIILKKHLPAQELCLSIQQSEIVICRSGYTTIMDLIKLRQKAILIPTPGQPEQEYLADHLYKQKMFYSISQKDFKLVKSIEDASQFEYKIPDADMNLYKNVANDFIEKISS